MATLPVEYIGSIIFSQKDRILLELFGLVKLIRILRLGRLISYLNLREDYQLSLKIVRLVFFLVLYLHLVGCLWFFMVRQNEEWIPPYDYVWIKTDLFERSITYQYFASVYHSVLMLTGNDVGPRGSLQVLFVAFFIALGAIVNA